MVTLFTTVEMMPRTDFVHPAPRHNAVDVRMVEQIGTPRMKMSEALLYVHYVLSVFQEMRGRTVPQVVDGDGMVECDPRQCVLEDDSLYWAWYWLGE